MNNPRSIELHSLVEECMRGFRDWNPRSLDKISAFLEEGSFCINVKNPSGKRALKLVLDGRSTRGYSRNLPPLKCFLEMVRLLLHHGANANCLWFHKRDYPQFICWCASIQHVARIRLGFDIVQILLYAKDQGRSNDDYDEYLN